MRIAYVVDTWPRLTETFVAREIAAVSAHHDVRVLALARSGEEATSDEVRGLASRVTWLPEGKDAPKALFALARALAHPTRDGAGWVAAFRGRGESGLRRAPALLAVATAWRAWGVERIHAHFARWATSAAEILAAATGAPFGFTGHAYDLFVRPERLAGKTARASWVVTCTASGRRALARHVDPRTLEKIVVVRHGVDLDAYRPGDGPRAPGPLRVLAVGRLVEKKGFHHLVEALGRLAAAHVPFEARIVGDGPDGSALAAQAARLGLADALTFVPACPPAAVRDLMRGWADVLTAPSIVARDGDRDGIPNVVGEALACGVPVVATTAGGLPELVIDGANGIVVPEGAPAALAAALERLAATPTLRTALAIRAREVAVERFDAKANVARFLEVLEAGGAGG